MASPAELFLGVGIKGLSEFSSATGIGAVVGVGGGLVGMFKDGIDQPSRKIDSTCARPSSYDRSNYSQPWASDGHWDHIRLRSATIPS